MKNPLSPNSLRSSVSLHFPCGWLFGLLLATSAAMADDPIVLGELPLLFADDSGVASAKNIRRAFHPASTLGEPVVAAERSWEGGRVYVYGSVIFSPERNQFQMWYGTPKPSKVLYAISADGVRWTKPALGLFESAEWPANNIVYHGHSASVLRDEFEADASRRYKLLSAGSDGDGYTATSPDGVRWRPISAEPVFHCLGGDTMTLTQNPRTGEYLVYHKNLTEIRGYVRRTVWLTRSPDFKRWSEPVIVFAPDEQDEAWIEPQSKQRTDVYGMSVFPHAAGFLGLPAIFRVEKIRPKDELSPGQAGDDGPIDIQLVTSTDGVQWARTEPRLAIIPRGAHGDFDRGALLGVTNTPVHAGDKTWIYYTALTTTHGAPVPPKRIAIGRAEWRLHGFASLDAEGEGEIQTKLLRFSQARLMINADAARGDVRVELRDGGGKVLSGYSFADSEPLARDQTRQVARWKSGATIPVSQSLVVVLKLKNARLFSLWSGAE